MAAGTSSRFIPLSCEIPKGLLEVRGEVLVERIIRQLKEAGVNDITIVTGYKANMFSYLRDKYGVDLIFNDDYGRYNNTSSIIRVLERLDETYVCCSDNYFKENVFVDRPKESYYAVKYAEGNTGEYCINVDENDYITGVSVGGCDAWYMAGQVFFSKSFSAKFRRIMIEEYRNEETREGYWEDVYIRHLDELPMLSRKYSDEDIFEFDTLDELRVFDNSYINNTRSSILKDICVTNNWDESSLKDFKKISFNENNMIFQFQYLGNLYQVEWSVNKTNIIQL